MPASDPTPKDRLIGEAIALAAYRDELILRGFTKEDAHNFVVRRAGAPIKA